MITSLKVIAAWGLPETTKYPYLTVWYAAGLLSIGVADLVSGRQTEAPLARNADGLVEVPLGHLEIGVGHLPENVGVFPRVDQHGVGGHVTGLGQRF